MSRTPAAAHGRRGKSQSPQPPRSANPETKALEPIPVKPRRKLFVVLMIVLAAWVAGLLVMYFTTVAR